MCKIKTSFSFSSIGQICEEEIENKKLRAKPLKYTICLNEAIRESTYKDSRRMREGLKNFYSQRFSVRGKMMEIKETASVKPRF
jgi:uncharacterized protein YlaI